MKCDIEVHILGYQCSYYLIVIYLRFLKTPQAIFQPEILGKSGNLRYFGTKLFEFTVDWLIFLDILKSKRKTLRASAPCISERWVWIEVKRRTHILASIQYHYFGTDLLAPSFLSSPTRPRWRDSRRSWRTGCAGLRTTIGRSWVFVYTNGCIMIDWTLWARTLWKKRQNKTKNSGFQKISC